MKTTMKQLARLAAQIEMHGTGGDIGGLLKIKSAAPMKAAKAQQACDLGLFSDDAKQLDLIQQKGSK